MNFKQPDAPEKAGTRYFSQVDLFSLLADAPPSEGATTLTMPVLPEGEFAHPRYGQLSWTPARFTRMIANHEAQVTGYAPMLNADHATQNPFAVSAPAYGWLKRLFHAPGQGLMAEVELTDLGEEAIRQKRYRYLSAEVWAEYADSRGETFEDVISGLALTNTPFHDTMPGLFGGKPGPAVQRFSAQGEHSFWVAAAEGPAVAHAGSTSDLAGQAAGAAGGARMDLGKTIRKLFGMPDTATDEDLVVAAAARSAQAEPVAGKVVDLPEPAVLSQAQPLKGVVTLSEAEVAQLRADAAEAETLRQQVQEAQQAQALSQATAAVEGYITAGKITPAQREHALKFALQDPEAFAAMYDAAPAAVNLSSHGNANLNRAASQTAADSYEGLVLQKSTQEGLSLDEAAAEVARMRPELYEKYRTGVAGRQN